MAFGVQVISQNTLWVVRVTLHTRNRSEWVSSRPLVCPRYPMCTSTAAASSLSNEWFEGRVHGTTTFTTLKRKMFPLRNTRRHFRTDSIFIDVTFNWIFILKKLTHPHRRSNCTAKLSKETLSVGQWHPLGSLRAQNELEDRNVEWRDSRNVIASALWERLFTNYLYFVVFAFYINCEIIYLR